jgi:hypothetical protein
MSNNYNINNPGGFFNYPGLPIPTGENPCEGNDNEGNCGAGLNVLNSASISWEGSGNTCTPLLAFVNLSQVAGNKLTIFGDGLYTSGGTGIPSIPSTQIAFGSSGNTLTSSPNLIYNPATGGLQTVDLLVWNTGKTRNILIAQDNFFGFNTAESNVSVTDSDVDILSGGLISLSAASTIQLADGNNNNVFLNSNGITLQTSQSSVAISDSEILWDTDFGLFALTSSGFNIAGNTVTIGNLTSTGTTMVVASPTGLLSTLPLPTFSNVFGANDGLSISGTNAILGGVTLTNKTIDLSVNNNYLWLKESLAPSTYSQFIVGGASGGTAPGSTWGFPHPALLISKSITADGNNSVFLEMSNPDAPSGSSYNGFLILNYQNVAGQVQPNIRAASNALAGQGGAFNLDLAGRDSYSVNGYQDNYSHFSIWYYDYDQYFYTNPGAPGPMLNSDFVNFNNGQGGGAGSTRFFMIDKHYNTLLGKGTWNQTPASTLDIQDNGSGQTGIYQRGATSPNWFAGDTVIGGPLPAHFGSTYQLTVSGNTQITGVLELTGMTTPDQDGAGPGMISCQGIPLLHFGANDSQDTYSVYLGMYAGYAARTTSGADVQSAVAVGFGALQAYTGVQNFWGAVLGTGCAQALTSGIGDLIAGWATANTSTSLSGSTILGSMAGVVVNGTDLTFVGVGAGGSPNYSSIYTATATASGSTVIGAWAGSGLSHVTMDNIILLGRFANKTTNNSVVWNNTTIIGNSITTDLNNVAIFGSSTQDVIIGNSNPTVDNGYKLQVNGSTYINGNALITSLASTGTTMVVASSTGLLGTQPIPQSAVSSVSNSDGTLTISPTTGSVIASLNLAHANTWTGVATFNENALGATTANMLSLTNTTAAVNGTQQVSPALLFQGSGYGTTGLAAQTVAFQQYVQPVQGTTPTGTLTIATSINGAAYTNLFTLTSAGVLNVESAAPEFIAQLTGSGTGGFYMANSGGAQIAGIQVTGSSGEIRHIAGSGSYFPTFYSNNAEAMRISAAKNVLIGTTTDAGELLQVNGEGAFTLNNIGSTMTAGLLLTNTTAATSTLQQQSPALVMTGQGWKSSATAVSESVTFQQYVLPITGAAAATGEWILQSSISGATAVNLLTVASNHPGTIFNSTGILVSAPNGPSAYQILNNTSNGGVGYYGFQIGLNNVYQCQSGTGGGVNITGTMNPSAGSGVFNLLALTTTINQPSGATGISRALYINPTLTSYTNFRAIEITAGSVVHAAATANYSSLNIPTGSAPTSPNEGDIWKTGTHLFIYLNGTTVQIV